MKVKFWGARGSIPAPLKPQEVREKIVQAIMSLPPLDPRDEVAVRAYVESLPVLRGGTAGGNTPCVQILGGEAVIAVDAGSGLRELGMELMQGAFGQGQGALHLFLSHTHWDHIHGFTMFNPAFVPGNRIILYGVHDLRRAFEQQHVAFNWPVTLEMITPQLEFVQLQPGEPITLGDMQVVALKGHHPGDSYCYRFTDRSSSLIYATDMEYKQLRKAALQVYVDFFREADALIFDAQYTLRDAWTKVDWGHSSALIGVDLARAAGVKKLILFHHDPTYCDQELEQILDAATLYSAQMPDSPPDEIIIAYEGLLVNLTPERAVDVQLTPEGDATVFVPARLFDELEVEQLARLFEAGALDVAPVVDLSQVETLTTGGLKALVNWQQLQGRPIVLVTPSQNIQNIIHLSGYPDCFAVYPSVTAALAAMRASAAAYLPGQLIQGRYQITRRLGESSLGAVLEAWDTRENSPVALKVLSPIFSPQTLDHLFRQARQIIALEHPHIVKVFAWERAADAVYQVETLMTAPTLEDALLVTGSALPGEQVWELARDIAQALEYAHSQGVIHGDLKPANIFLTPKGARVGGFGLGRLTEGRNLQDALLLFMEPTYLAPEQILGHALDARTDLYALGVILYRLFTGHYPFTGEAHEVLRAHLDQLPRPPSDLNSWISPSLEHLILKLLAKNPNDRYASSIQTQRVSSSLAVYGEEVQRFTRARLVGRRAQQDQLFELWTKANRGQGQLVFISGEPGVGKTTLAQQAAVQSGSPVVLLASAEERAEMPAYYLFAQALRAYFATVPPELLDMESCQLIANFVMLLPDIQPMLPELPPVPVLEPAQERLRLMGNVTRFVRRATQTRPWVLILDNLHWADVNSLELLRYLARHTPTMNLLLVGVYRDTDLPDDHPLKSLLRALSREPIYRHIALERLDEAATQVLLEDIWQCSVPDSLTRRIYQHTEGNPFYIEELAKDLVDEGVISSCAVTWELPQPETLALPGSVREVVMRRISQLPSDVQSLLTQAAILGQSFHFEELRELSGLSLWETLEYLDVALERQLIQEMSGEGRLRFRHREIQQALYGDVGPLRRRLLHRQAGEVLEKRADASGGARIEELAYHFSQAGEPERFIAYSLPVAQQAQAAYANETALLWYTRTFEMLQMLPESKGETFHPLLLTVHRALSDVLTQLARYDEAQQHAEAALAQLDLAPATEAMARQRAGVCCQIARTYEARSDYAQALTWIEQGLRCLESIEPGAEQAQLYRLTGWVHTCQGRYPQARTHLEAGLALARRFGLQQIEAQCLRTLGVVAWYAEEAELSPKYFSEALALYQVVGDRQGEAHSLSNLGVWSISEKNYAEAHGYYTRALEIYDEIGDRAGAAGALHNVAIIARDQGIFDVARDTTLRVLAVREEVGDRRGVGLTLDMLSGIFRLYGDYEQALRYVERALVIRNEIGDRLGQAETLNTLAATHYYLGHYETTLAFAEQALAIFDEIPNYYDEAFTRIYQGRSWRALGRLEEARVAFQVAYALREHVPGSVFYIRALAGLTQLNLDTGDLARALFYVEEILEAVARVNPIALDEPCTCYLVCYQVLTAFEDPRAPEVLHLACSQLQTRAAAIHDPEVRRFFLENVAAHRGLLQLCEYQTAPEAVPQL